MLYPLKFHPIFKEKIWGGEKIKTHLNKDFSPLNRCGESWEISGVEGNISIVRDGRFEGRNLKSLIAEFKGNLTGQRVYRKYGREFPLLIKFIDANDDLSIQVHPNDELANSRHRSFGKSEMWYILQADKDASLICGFNRPVNKDTYLEYFERGRLVELLNREKVKEEDTFFIPAGRIHTIGKGLLLAEIQQTSDITYRIYDFDRVDGRGRKRKLHIDDALDAIDFNFYNQYRTVYTDKINEEVELVSCKYFTTNKLAIQGSLQRDYDLLDSFVVLICVEGKGNLRTDQFLASVSLGDVILIPASIKKLYIESDHQLKLLETFVTPFRE